MDIQGKTTLQTKVCLRIPLTLIRTVISETLESEISRDNIVT